MDNLLRKLRRLARLYGVQLDYYDVFGRVNRASPDGLLRILRALGAPVERLENVKDALRERLQSIWRGGMEPVTVAWDGEPVRLKLRLERKKAEGTVQYDIALENGEHLRGSCFLDGPAVGKEVEGVEYVLRRVTIPEKPPRGYHRIMLRNNDLSLESLLISAPLRAPGADSKSWGVFLPLYALHSGRSWGAGNFSDLKALLGWLNEAGGKVIGTLPLLASFLDEPFEPSPYSPLSRLFWNEFFIDVTQAPELADCPEARSLLSSTEFQDELSALRAAPLIDYRREMALKRKVLEKLARSLCQMKTSRYDAFRRFVNERPPLDDYARFRAMTETQRKPWRAWPEVNREGTLKQGDYDDEASRYHLYVQWLADEQLETLANQRKRGGTSLYLDLPLGVHRDGYDVWRERGSFAPDISGGAPPDKFFTRGQNWGFPPLHPEELRRQGYRYFIACLRHHLKYASMLRIDHIMGLHRLFWIPMGRDAQDGAYVSYQAEELYAILNLESHRFGAQIVGENLGTVPPTVNQALDRHQIDGMYVTQFSINPNPERPLGDIPSRTVASLNTHDTPTFASFWSGEDIEDRRDLGLLSDEQAEKEHSSRRSARETLVAYLRRRGWVKEEEARSDTVLKACLLELAQSPAELLLVNLEDLWLETEPQNVPGTWKERANWRRKAAHALEAFLQMPEIDILKEIDRLREQNES